MTSRYRRKALLAIAAWTFAASSSAFAARILAYDRFKITGIYSDLAMSSDDIVGMEISISLARDGYYAVIQFGEGTATIPIVVPVIVDGQQIEFSVVMPTGLTGKFRGKVSRNGITGKFDGEGEIFTLPRKKSLWQ